MKLLSSKATTATGLALVALASFAACSESTIDRPSDPGDGDGDGDGDGGGEGDGDVGAGGQGGAPAVDDAEGYILSSVVIDPEGRTTYVQVVDSLDGGRIGLDSAIETPGSAIFLASGRDFFIGAQEQPTFTKYSVASDLSITEKDTISFSNFTSAGVGYAHTIVDEETAVTVIVDQAVAVVWNPETMVIKGEIDLEDMLEDGYSWEAWTTSSHEGRVYVPGRYANWDTNEVRDGVRLAILDPHALELVGIAHDDRCSSGGKPVFDADGYAYVMGDGRNYIKQMAANALGEVPPENCLLRIAPGATDFEEDYYYSVQDLTGGLESITELATAVQGSGYAVAKMFYPDKLPEGVEPIDYGFWSEPAFKMWRIELGEQPVAIEVENAPFAGIGYTGVETGQRYYVGETPDGEFSEVYEVDLAANVAVKHFEIVGYFTGIHLLD